MKTNLKKSVVISMLAAVSLVLVTMIRIPFPAAPFLEYDPADIPIIIGTIVFGLPTGIILTAVVSLLQGVIFSSQSGIIGILMHFLATGAYVLGVGLLLRKNKKLIVGLIAGAILMTITMILWNMIFTPVFMGVPFSQVKGMIIPIIVPFNLIKSGVNGIISYLLYKILKKTDIFKK